MAAQVKVFGIRHHGPGSARSLCAALEQLAPDLVLVEGPPEAESLLPQVLDAQMVPPVALLIYAEEAPEHAAFYPFTQYSPEWQAIHYAVSRSVPVRFIDLPQAIALAPAVKAAQERAEQEKKLAEQPEPAANTVAEAETDKVSQPEAEPASEPSDESASQEAHEAAIPEPYSRRDPLDAYAEIAGYADGETFWEALIEQRRNPVEIFEAVTEAMRALRQAQAAELAARTTPLHPLHQAEEIREARREACMREAIRAGVKEGRERIAVVCGAWHAPVLAEQAADKANQQEGYKFPPAKEDAALLRGLPKVKTSATWIPWTYPRMSQASGYGAGVLSPGWYEHLWSGASSAAWLVRVARLLRGKDLSASSAEIIDAERLAVTLAALGARHAANLNDLQEAALAVLCHGNPLPLQLVHAELIVGHAMGSMPDGVPAPPITRDLIREQKRLRLKPEALERELDLDLRKPNDLERSLLLHRLDILGVPWGKARTVHGKSGTFHELWMLRWDPEFAIGLIEAGRHGQTVAHASARRASEAIASTSDLQSLAGWLERVLKADLAEAAASVISRLHEESARAADTALILRTLAPLVNVVRYGDVRKTDVSLVSGVLRALVVRAAVGLPLAVAAIDDAAARAMLKHINTGHAAIELLNEEDDNATWTDALQRVSASPASHPLCAGRATRLLLDKGILQGERAAQHLGQGLSDPDPERAANWIDGFVSGSGLILVHDERLWALLDQWVSGLSASAFDTAVPLLRRAFSSFNSGERHMLGQRVRTSPLGPTVSVLAVESEFDMGRALQTLPVLAQLLGIPYQPTEQEHQ